jgi:hypothetical protein
MPSIPVDVLQTIWSMSLSRLNITHISDPSIRTFKLNSFSSYFSYDESIRNFLNNFIVLIYFLLRVTNFSRSETIISSPAIQPVQHAETSVYIYLRSISFRLLGSYNITAQANETSLKVHPAFVKEDCEGILCSEKMSTFPV